jgi:hypothetical protein
MISQLWLPELCEFCHLEDKPWLGAGSPPLKGALISFMPVILTYVQLLWRIS